MSKIAPLRLVVLRTSSFERLECGHLHPKTYRIAQRRRCKECLIVDERNRHFKNLEEKIEPVIDITPVDLALIPPPSDQPRCAYCHDDLDNKVLTCNGCRTILHKDCASEAGRCPTLGCRGSFQAQGSLARSLSTPRPLIVITRPRSKWRMAWNFVAFIPRLFYRGIKWFLKEDVIHTDLVD